MEKRVKMTTPPKDASSQAPSRHGRTSPDRAWRLVLLALGTALAVVACQAELSEREVRARRVNNEGVVYMDQHNYTRGRDLFQQTISLDPGYASGHVNLGIAYFSLGKYDSARVALEKGLELDPHHLHALYTLGLIFHAQGREYERALEAFQAVAASDPDDPLVRYYLGRTKAKLGRGEEAIGEFERAIALDPNNVSAYYAMAHELRIQGQLDTWKQTLEKFNRLSQAGFDGVSASYQGQGKYAEAAPDGGYVLVNAGDGQAPLAFAAPQPGLPAGAPLDFVTLEDADGDGAADLVAGAPLQLYRNGGGSFTPSSTWQYDTGTLGQPRAVNHADLDDDGDMDAVVAGAETVMLRHQEGHLAPGAALSGPSDGAVFADVDHDGDTDVLLLGGAAARLLFNDGTGALADGSATAGLAPVPAAGAVFTDFDNDRDVDFLVRHPEGDLSLYSSNRDGTFSDVAARVGLSGHRAEAFAVADVHPDGYMDLLTAAPDGGLHLLANERGRAFADRPLEGSGGNPATALRPADLDNDGDLDLVVARPGGLELWRNTGGQLQRVEAGLDPAESPRHLLVDDFDGDGLVDLLVNGQLLRNATHGGNSIRVHLAGLNSNAQGFGAKVEVKTAARHQKREVRGGSADAPVLTFGLADQDSVESVRILWPSGVRQTELATAAGSLVEVAELNRKGTSCPVLFAWDGSRFRFVSDFLGGAIIGYLVGPREYYEADTDEYLPLGDLGLKDGNYVLQVTNQLEEIVYLDAAELVAVDHLDALEVRPNEHLLSAPPYPEFRLYGLSDLRPPVSVVDHRGQRVDGLLRHIDDDWYEGFERSDIHGYANDFALTLDLGDLSAWERPVLVAHGWVDYAHSTSNWAAAQRGVALYPPRLEVPDGRGGWRVALADMGVPAGLPKGMLVDLEGLLTPGDHRVRIVTNTSVYWDQFLVGDAPETPMRVHRRAFASADLHWRGYAEFTSVKGTFALRYHYDRLVTEAPFGTHGGAYTRFGEVAPLLDEVDDQYVIMFRGDELTLEVPAESLPPLGPGFRRTFLFYADGFGKDMDFHSAYSLMVEPLPFHGMSSYPYPTGQSYPETAEHQEYQLQYNTRLIRGDYR